MNKDEIDIMWQKAMKQSIEDGEIFTRYHFAKLVAERALADSMREVQRLGQEIEQEPVAHPERHELQAKGEHPAPCARHCEANALQIVIKNLKAQLAQPEQEPVYHLRQYGDVTKEQLDRYIETGDINPPATQPAQRKPLTDEEIRSIWNDGDCYEEIAFARAIEAKLKEKNT